VRGFLFPSPLFEKSRLPAVHIQQLKYVSRSAAKTESDVGKHAWTACGSARVIRKNDGIKGDEREMPGHETVCGGLYRHDLNGLQ